MGGKEGSVRFEDFWWKRNRAGNPPVEVVAKDAWDAALCAVQAEMHEDGRLRSAEEIRDIIRDLHSWTGGKDHE